MPVAIGDSVFYACQAAREAMLDSGRAPEWLILGDEEWRRLTHELTAFPNIDREAAGQVVTFQGMKVARYNVPSHLEVLPRCECQREN